MLPVCMQSVKYAFHDQRSYYENEEQLRLAQLALKKQQEQEQEQEAVSEVEQEQQREQERRRSFGSRIKPLAPQQQQQVHTEQQEGPHMRRTVSQQQSHQQQELQQATGIQNPLSQQHSRSIKAAAFQQQALQPSRQQWADDDELRPSAAGRDCKGAAGAPSYLPAVSVGAAALSVAMSRPQHCHEHVMTTVGIFYGISPCVQLVTLGCGPQ
jgi:hypothetical protein